MIQIIKITIPFQLPGANEYIDSCRRNAKAANRTKQRTEDAILWAIKSQIQNIHFDCPVFICYTWFEPNRKRDKDNIAFGRKFIQDAIVRAGVLKNDGWAQIHGFSDSFDVDRINPRVEIEITKYVPVIPAVPVAREEGYNCPACGKFFEPAHAERNPLYCEDCGVELKWE